MQPEAITAKQLEDTVAAAHGDPLSPLAVHTSAHAIVRAGEAHASLANDYLRVAAIARELQQAEREARAAARERETAHFATANIVLTAEQLNAAVAAATRDAMRAQREAAGQELAGITVRVAIAPPHPEAVALPDAPAHEGIFLQQFLALDAKSQTFAVEAAVSGANAPLLAALARNPELVGLSAAQTQRCRDAAAGITVEDRAARDSRHAAAMTLHTMCVTSAGAMHAALLTATAETPPQRRSTMSTADKFAFISTHGADAYNELPQ